MMVRAGVGALTVIDRDYVEESNLQRQSLFDEADAARGLPKAAAAEARLRALNSDVDGARRGGRPRGGQRGRAARRRRPRAGRHRQLRDALPGERRLRARRASPWVYGACVGAYGLALLVRPHVSPCLRCVLEEMPPPGSSPTCDTAGVVAPIVHVVAGIQAGGGAEAAGRPRRRRCCPGIVTVDLWQGTFEVMDLRGQRAVVPGLHGGALRLRGRARRRRPPSSAAATRCRSARRAGARARPRGAGRAPGRRRGR